MSVLKIEFTWENKSGVLQLLANAVMLVFLDWQSFNQKTLTRFVGVVASRYKCVRICVMLIAKCYSTHKHSQGSLISITHTFIEIGFSYIQSNIWFTFSLLPLMAILTQQNIWMVQRMGQPITTSQSLLTTNHHALLIR